MPAGGRPETSWMHYTTSCKTQSSAPEDGQTNCPKHVELTGIINKPLLLHIVDCLYYLYQWCTVKKISDNEIYVYLLIKYIKSVLWRVAKCLSYIEEARCLKVKVGHGTPRKSSSAIAYISGCPLACKTWVAPSISILRQWPNWYIYFTIHLLWSSTCFEHCMLIIRRLNCIDAASGIVTLSKWLSGAQVERELVGLTDKYQN